MDSASSARKRVRAACDRCRRQKLKCDNARPCALCMRSGVECVGDPERSRKRRAGSAAMQTNNELNLGQIDSQVSINHTIEEDLSDDRYHIVTTVGATSTENNVNQAKQADTSTSKLYSQGKSALGLTREILQQFESSIPPSTATSALPGGQKSGDHSIQSSSSNMPLSVILGIELPSIEICDFLVDTYFDSVHWFMLVIHEPSFRKRYQELMQFRHVSQREIRFVSLVMLILAMGARYVSPESALEHTAGIDLSALQSSLLAKVRENMFDIFDEGAIESVQICILLSSFYLYHGRPNLAFIILGSGVRAAQVMGLHQESSWKPSSIVTRETMRRVWWALYVFDRFASTIFGRPCSIAEQDCNVSMPINMEDTSARHPVHASLETLDDGSISHVTIFSYQRYKFRLYRLASAVVNEIYTHRIRSASEIVGKVRTIHEKLLEWFQSLPVELQHNRGVMSQDTTSNVDLSGSITRTFELQALALQLAYDNIQILLHRPLLSYNLKRVTRALEHANDGEDGPCLSPRIDGQSGMNTPQPLIAALALSKKQCWESAIRTSLLSSQSRTLKSAHYTHAATYIGINLFTAGMVLSIVALSKPLSSQSQEAKQAIARVVQMSDSLGRSSVLSAQSGNILQDLVRLILEKEMKSIFQGPSSRNSGNRSNTTQDSSKASEASKSVSRLETQNTGEINDDLRHHVGPTQGLDLNEHMSSHGLSDAFDGSDPGYSPAIDFNAGISSLQHVIRHHANPYDAANFTTERAPDSSSNGMQVPLDDTYPASSEMSGAFDLQFGGFGGLQDMQQTWLWNPQQDHLFNMSFGGRFD